MSATEKELRDMLAECAEVLEDALSYMPQYFREKWQYDDTVKKARELLNK